MSVYCASRELWAGAEGTDNHPLNLMSVYCASVNQERTCLRASRLIRQRPLLCAAAGLGAACAVYRYFYQTRDRRPDASSIRVPLEDTQRGLQDVLALDTEEEHLSSRLVLHRCALPAWSPAPSAQSPVLCFPAAGRALDPLTCEVVPPLSPGRALVPYIPVWCPPEAQTQTSPWEELSAHSSGEPAPAPACNNHQVRLTLDRLALCKVLGKGAFGKVLLAELKGSGQYFALKALKKDVVNVEDTMVEKRVLALARESPFLSELYSSFQTTEHLFFVMEYLNGGTLFFHLSDKERFDVFESTFYSAEVIVGLQFLHAKGIIHRDLKLENIMLAGDGHVKIVDFGLCKENVCEENPAYGICGTAPYMAPEMLLEQTYTFSADWWSFGVILYDMLAGEPLFDADEDEELYELIKTAPLEYPKDLNQEALDLLQKVLERDPSLRLGMVGDIRGHPFYQTLDWSALERRELEPPFKPEVTGPGDCPYAEEDVEGEEPRLSHTGTVMDSGTQTAFTGFTYANPEMERLLSANKLAPLES